MLSGPLCTEQRKFIIFRLLFGLIAITRDELCEKHSNTFAIRNVRAVKFSIDCLTVLLADFDPCRRRILLRPAALPLCIGLILG
jgi:hypothetical protein